MHNIVVNLEYSTGRLLGLLSVTVCVCVRARVCISSDSLLPYVDSHNSKEFLNEVNDYQLFRDLVILNWLCVVC